MELKKDIRKRVLEKRSLMTQEEWDEKSHRIFKQVVTHPFFFAAHTICAYVDYRREVGTADIIETAWAQGKKVAVPRIENGTMHFYYIASWDDLESGYCNIQEPTTSEQLQDKEPLVIMPGAVFDASRNRIGYGKGFYDRFLHELPRAKTIALAFQLQLEESIPFHEHDVRPQILITEEHMYAESITTRCDALPERR